jgi:ribosomal protein S27E
LDESKTISFDLSALLFEVRQNVRHNFRLRLRARMLAQFRIGINVTGLPASPATRAMKELKFKCPSCGQHIQCDWKYAGENVPCPGCATLIRVPHEGDVTDVPSPPTEASPVPPVTGEAEKVSYIHMKPADGTEPKKSPAAPERAEATSTSSPPANPDPPVAPKPELPPAAHAPHALELHCVCPVCQSALRILVEPEPHLEAVHHAAPTSAEQLPPAERERQIAAGRERVLHKMTEKPRLDRILGGHAAEPSSPSEKK